MIIIENDNNSDSNSDNDDNNNALWTLVHNTKI